MYDNERLPFRDTLNIIRQVMFYFLQVDLKASVLFWLWHFLFPLCRRQ